jgi:hypothetical protein
MAARDFRQLVRDLRQEGRSIVIIGDRGLTVWANRSARGVAAARDRAG